jgi:hypothetical protein
MYRIFVRVRQNSENRGYSFETGNAKVAKNDSDSAFQVNSKGLGT